MICELEDKIFSVTPQTFDELALQVFHFQYQHNQLYQRYADAIGRRPGTVQNLCDIPFLPISFFKSHDVVTGSFTPEVIFESSGTTRTGNSRHLVRSAELYRTSFMRAFELFYGDVRTWCIVGLLPSYLERQHSSLVMMVAELIARSGHPASSFYLYDQESLASLLRRNEQHGQRTLVIGVTFALLDFAASFPMPLHHTTVMETGGMKGRQKEITREEVHAKLKSAWGLDAIHSEYGMTELLSQAYSSGSGLFHCPPWMKMMAREEDDPLTVKGDTSAASGLLNVIDLANLYSCSFIATDDLCRLYEDGAFEVQGRVDGSDIRGCSLLYV